MSPRWRIVLLGLAACAALGAGAQQPTSLERGANPLRGEGTRIITRDDVPDPHGVPDLCGECHATGPDGALDTSPPPMAACERCHPDTNFHLVGVEPDKVESPEDMLLQDGQVACLTCHDEPACDGLAKDARGKDHFRGGPYRHTLDLCFRCHDRQEYQRTDPHRDLRTPDGRRNDAVCVFCHQGVPDSTEDTKVETLRVDPLELCKGCHAFQIHVGIPSHLKLLKPEKLALVESWNAQAEYPIPIGPRGEVKCTSCHDPHPGMEAIATASSPAKLAELRVENRRVRDTYTLPRLKKELTGITDADGRTLELEDGPAEKEGLLRVPAEDGTLCLICHDLDAEGR